MEALQASSSHFGASELVVLEGWTSGIKEWRSFRASCACVLTEMVGVVLTDWMIMTVSRTESSKVSRCFRWSAIMPLRETGRDSEGLKGPACECKGTK